jgi:hypothetical protein
MLVDESAITIRRVAYDVAREVALLRQCGLPHSDWIARTIEAGSFQAP